MWHILRGTKVCGPWGEKSFSMIWHMLYTLMDMLAPCDFIPSKEAQFTACKFVIKLCSCYFCMALHQDVLLFSWSPYSFHGIASRCVIVIKLCSCNFPWHLGELSKFIRKVIWADTRRCISYCSPYWYSSSW